MLNKKDPLIGAVQEVMKRNHAEREATRLVNEKFGIADRKALPHEYQAQWNAEYQQVLSESADLAALAPPHHKVTKKDVLVGRGVLEKHPTKPGKHILAKEEEQIDERKLNPYAVGMAAVQKSTGDKPPMEKKNIMKAHKIAKKIMKKKAMNEHSIEAIQEEISYNLSEQAYNIFENDGADNLVAFINSLNEEQLELLGMNEEFIEFVINEGLWDSISAGARGAWDSATLGAGKYVSGAVRHGYKKLTGQKSNYLDQVDQEDKANKEAEKNNPKSYNAGWYGGLAASMLAPGGAAVQGAKLAGKAALKAGAKSLGASAAKAAGVGVGVGTADALRDTRNKPAMNEEFILENLEAIQEELANHLYENYTLEEINSLTEENLNYIVYEGLDLGIGKFIGNLVGKKVVAPAVTATAKKTAQASANAVKKQAATAASKRFNVAGAQAVAKAPKAKKAATTAAAPAASSTVSKTTQVLDRMKKAGQAIRRNPGKTAAGLAAAGVGAAALSSDDTSSSSSSEPPKYTGDVKYTQGSADSQRAMSTTGQAAKAAVPVPKAKPTKNSAKAPSSKTKSSNTSTPKVAAQPKKKLTSFQKFELRRSEKNDTVDQTRNLERRYGIRAPMKKAKKSIFQEQIQNIIAEKATGGMVAQKQKVDARAQGFPARPAASPSTSGTSTAFGGPKIRSDAINNLGRVSKKDTSMMPAAASKVNLSGGGSAKVVPGNTSKNTTSSVISAVGGPPKGSKFGERPATNAQLTAQAKARQGFGAPAGGNYQSAQAKASSSGAPTMKPGTSLNKPTGWNPFTGQGKAPVTQPANPMMGEKKPKPFEPGKIQNRKNLAKDVQAGRAGTNTALNRAPASSGVSGNPMGDYNPGQENSTPTSPKSQAQLNTSPTVKTRPNLPTATQAKVPSGTQQKVKKGDTMWGYAKQDIKQSRNLAASGPLGGSAFGGNAGTSGAELVKRKITNKDIAAKTEKIKALNPTVNPRKMQIGSTIKTS